MTWNIDPNASTAEIYISLQGAIIVPFDFEHWSTCIYSVDPYVATRGKDRPVDWLVFVVRTCENLFEMPELIWMIDLTYKYYGNGLDRFAK